jgi:hypothetical protein
MAEPKKVSDARLEELRKFLTSPGPEGGRTPAEVYELIRDMTWAVEELQIRRVSERAKVDLERPYLLFGSEEGVLAYVEKSFKRGENWKHVSKLDELTHVLPQMVIGLRVDDANPDIWEAWREILAAYGKKP